MTCSTVLPVPGDSQSEQRRQTRRQEKHGGEAANQDNAQARQGFLMRLAMFPVTVWLQQNRAQRGT